MQVEVGDMKIYFIDNWFYINISLNNIANYSSQIHQALNYPCSRFWLNTDRFCRNLTVAFIHSKNFRNENSVCLFRLKPTQFKEIFSR